MRSWSNKGQIRLAIYALASGVVAFATLAHVLQSRATRLASDFYFRYDSLRRHWREL